MAQLLFLFSPVTLFLEGTNIEIKSTNLHKFPFKKIN